MKPEVDMLYFGVPARDGVVLTDGGNCLAVWNRDKWKRGSPWRLVREIPLPITVTGETLRLIEGANIRP